MQAELSAFIKDHGLFSTKDHLLLAVSGGVDSMTLLHLLMQLGHRVSVAHMNFGLRGEASDLDEALVREVGNELHVAVFTRRELTDEYAKKQGVSIQMAARELRYRWFNQLVEEHHFDYVVTAHNADDNLETVLFNLTKGTGIKGLSGIKLKTGNLVRPFLFAEKSDVLSFAKANAIRWREDASNEDVKYIRNKIRHEVLPALKEINPSLISHFENTRRRLEGTRQIIMRRVDEVTEKHTRWSGDLFHIDQNWMSGQESDAVILSEILRPFGFSFMQCLEIIKAAGQSGKLFQSTAYVLNVDRGHFILKVTGHPITQPSVRIEAISDQYQFGDWLFHLTEHPISDFQKGSPYNEIFLDADSIQYPLTLRFWQQGDLFQPLGLGGKKKVSDFLVDQKIPLIEKSAVMVLESAGQICWVVNHRIDDRCKVTDKTRKLLKITCQKSFEDGPNTV